MGIKINDRSFMMVFLLEECNFACPHCVREDEPMEVGYKLSFGQLRSCLGDCNTLGSVRRVHFSGGEPTLWREGDLDLVDLLHEIAASGFTPGFISNGSLFCDYGRCYDFFRRYVDSSGVSLRFYLSIDTFHGNFDPGIGRAQSLDNVLRCKGELPENKGDLIGQPHVVVTVSKDKSSLLPDGMVAYYESKGVCFSFVPLVCAGRARYMKDLCPDLGSNDPDALGAYYRFAPELTGSSPEEDPNRPTADYLILIGEYYYIHESLKTGLDRGGWRKVAGLGQLTDSILRAYCEDR
jgi:MoaA/NifB/PqqE/SkfB family radical SAM enzyme